MRLRVTAVRPGGANVRVYSLVHADDAPLPPIAPGDHLELEVPDRDRWRPWVRQYSLTNYVAPGEVPRHYEVAIQREAEGRGGSKAFHDHLAVGVEVEARGPFNQFRFDDDDHKPLLIAGGIGITPLLSMARACQATGRQFELHFFCRDATQAPLIDEIRALTGGSLRVRDALSPEQAATAVTDLVGNEDPALTRIYVCGPSGLLDTVIDGAAAAGWDGESVRYERFSAAPGPDDTPFTATVAGSGARVNVAGNESLLDALARHGIDVPSSCQAGTCGTCLTMVLDGEVDHRDSVLTPDERAENSMMCICVSRAAGSELVIDL